jgi:hypothetical protein
MYDMMAESLDLCAVGIQRHVFQLRPEVMKVWVLP